MSPTHYYLDCGNVLRTKNKLHAEFAAYLQSLNSKLIDAEKLPELKKQINEKLESLNATFTRCTPIYIYYFQYISTESILIQGFYAVTFYIKPAYYESN